jgi:hypothetical protein
MSRIARSPATVLEIFSPPSGLALSESVCSPEDFGRKNCLEREHIRYSGTPPIFLAA